MNQIFGCLDFKEIETYKLDEIEFILNDRILEFKEINRKDLNDLKHFNSIKDKRNVILLSLLNKNLQKQHKNIEVNSYIENVLKKSYQEYLEIGQRLNVGTFLLKEFDFLARLKQNNTTNKYINPNWIEYFKILMNQIEIPEDIIKKRLEQIDVYLKLSNIEKICTVLLELKEKNKSTGDFEFLNEINASSKSSSYSNKPIKEIDDKVIQIYSHLTELSNDTLITCLESFIHNFDFVVWLKKCAPNLNAIKLLCDFASESENEGALEVIRVQSLSMVSTAYSPLIYDLKENFSCDDLIKQIKLVKQNLSKNPNLSEKINSIAKEKSWLEEIKDSKGNTEANSLKQATRINETGIFYIGLEKKKNENLSLNDVIRLEVPKKDKETEKLYSYLQLVDLNDKLTLVVGKETTQQNVIQEFEKIFEGLINMGQTYLDLIRTGNVLFNNWMATVYCRKTDAITMKVNFGLSNENQNIFACRKTEETTINSINKTIKFLKDSYNKWIEHVNSKREQYSVLDYFRIDQIVILRTELAKSINSEALVNNHKNLFDLLYNVNNQLTAEMINEANDFVFNNEKRAPKEPVTPEVLDAKQDKLFKDLNDFGFSNKLIRRALNELKTDDFNELVAYCIEHQMEDEELAPKKVEKSKTLLSFKSINILSDDENIDAYEQDEEPLELKYNSIWKRYSAYLDSNFEDFVSLDHLGKVLNYLKEESKLVVNRDKPAYLEKGVPNLISCPQDEIINRALSIYMLSENEPLPTNDEIIFCTSRTSFEEIELFWKRLLLDKEQKIYCLINVHDLLYDIAAKAVLSFEKLQAEAGSSKQNSEFMLCIFSSSEKEDKSVFATSFNRFKKNIPIERNIETKLTDYLSKHFKIQQSSSQLSLNNLDKSGLNVRVITSERSGVGKSLYIKRTIEKARSEINPHIKSLCISVKKQTLPYEEIFRKLKDFEAKTDSSIPRIFHFDIAYETWFEVDYFLFDLLCLGVLKNSKGEIFRRSFSDIYLIEIMTPKFKIKNKETQNDTDESNYKPLHNILSILPYLKCLTPNETLRHVRDAIVLPVTACSVLFDNEILRSDIIQRPCQYLQILNSTKNFDNFQYKSGKLLNVSVCLELLLRHLEHPNPSWSEIIHFASFLNNQLIDSEHSIFCNTALTGDLLPGFKTFVVQFMIQMSHDFALPSLVISDRSALQMTSNNQAAFELDQLKMRRKWENDPHPYLFFNPDGQTFTFFGFHVNKTNGTLVDPNTGKILFDNLTLQPNLIQGIDRQDPTLLRENIGSMSKNEKIFKLLRVMGVEWIQNNMNSIKDPDPSYELTMDNLLKMLAIYMRLKACIPVIIMGETGCGKTRLCKYMCELQIRPDENKKVNNMYLVKVHGGTTTLVIFFLIKNLIFQL
jgi:E3 ubiquitin-protein ligase RNF213